MRAELQERILAVVEAYTRPTDDLLLDIHRHQHAHCPVMGNLVEAPVSRIEDIPAVPVSFFRDLVVGTVSPNAPHRAFHTSGTTGTQSGIHRLVDTRVYDAGALRHAASWLPETETTLALIAERPTSSLLHMVRLFGPITGPLSIGFDQNGLIEERLNLDRPTFVCATAFALDAWLQHDPSPLPEGSAILTTGGFKGHAHALDADALVAAAQRIAPVVLEYGMTELSSQLWARPGEPFTPPPWLFVTAVDPATGTVLPPGSVGQLRFLDLCNLDGTLHIETHDRGSVDSEGRVTLHGRIADAQLRGCSLTAEAILG